MVPSTTDVENKKEEGKVRFSIRKDILLVRMEQGSRDSLDWAPCSLEP